MRKTSVVSLLLFICFCFMAAAHAEVAAAPATSATLAPADLRAILSLPQPPTPAATNACCANAELGCADRCSPCTHTLNCTPVGNSCTFTCFCHLTSLCRPK